VIVFIFLPHLLIILSVTAEGRSKLERQDRVWVFKKEKLRFKN